VETKKELARMTHKGYTGYMPIVGHLAENGLAIGDEFREGNEAPASRNLAFIKYSEKQLPRGKHIKAFRADSAACQAAVRQIKSLGTDDWRVYQNGFTAETVHCINKTEQAV
jgi:hypothetical protein